MSTYGYTLWVEIVEVHAVPMNFHKKFIYSSVGVSGIAGRGKCVKCAIPDLYSIHDFRNHSNKNMMEKDFRALISNRYLNSIYSYKNCCE